MEKYKNKNLPIKERVEDLLSRMTLDEKLEQMHCWGCVYTPEQQLEFMAKGEQRVDTEFYTCRGFTVQQLNEIQRYMVEKTRLGIPAFISTECVHGAPTPYTTIFPTNGCLAASFDLDLAAKAAHIEGKELKMLGFNRVYSPNVDLLRDGSIIGDINSVVLRDREMLAEEGIIFVNIAVDTSLRVVLGGPEIESRGFMKDDSEYLEEMKKIVLENTYIYLNKRNLDLSKASEYLRDNLNKYIYKETRKRPLIIPSIIDVK